MRAQKPVSLIDCLARQERTVICKIGAGIPLEAAVDVGRWAREMAEDLPSMSIGEATAIVSAVRSRILEAAACGTDPRSRIVAVRMAYAFLRAQGEGRYALGSPRNKLSLKHYVYKLWDETGALLYIGISDRGPVRLAEHHHRKPWFVDVERVEFERYESRWASEERERHLIRTLRPRYNIQHNRAGAA